MLLAAVQVPPCRCHCVENGPRQDGCVHACVTLSARRSWHGAECPSTSALQPAAPSTLGRVPRLGSLSERTAAPRRTRQAVAVAAVLSQRSPPRPPLPRHCRSSPVLPLAPVPSVTLSTAVLTPRLCSRGSPGSDVTVTQRPSCRTCVRCMVICVDMACTMRVPTGPRRLCLPCARPGEGRRSLPMPRARARGPCRPAVHASGRGQLLCACLRSCHLLLSSAASCWGPNTLSSSSAQPLQWGLCCVCCASPASCPL